LTIASKLAFFRVRDLDELFAALRRSSFRRRFRLNERDARYLAARGLATVERHARDFLHERLAPAAPANDGRQTPMRGHPVFVAQHATATCCRKCLARWHGIPAGRPMTADEVEHVVQAISRWLAARLPDSPAKSRADQGSLFDD
jgi:ribosomal protein L34E